MITHYLGTDEVAAYSRDLAARLKKLGVSFPTKWCALGPSGWKMAKTILRHLDADLASKVQLGSAHYERETESITFLTSNDGVTFGNEPVFVIDSAIHSGRSMTRLVESLRRAGAVNFVSYGLVLKSGSKLIPTFFGVVIDDKDRAYFDLEAIPNNRLHDKKILVGVLRLLSQADADAPIGDVGPPFETISVGDLLYDQETRSSQVYGYEENGQIIGFVSFRKTGTALFIDSIGTIKTERNKGIASAMLRWAETWGRSNRCSYIELWGFEDAIPVYTKYGYELVDNEWRTLGAGHRFKLMHKPLLYHIKVRPEGEEYRDY